MEKFRFCSELSWRKVVLVARAFGLITLGQLCELLSVDCRLMPTLIKFHALIYSQSGNI